ncbi:UNVERIFIED_CONTAM: hypothetical protein K2H54_074373 [Gekko kuhli]
MLIRTGTSCGPMKVELSAVAAQSAVCRREVKATRLPRTPSEKMAEYVQVAKRALQQLRGHGGLRGALVQFFRVNDLKTGTLVGTDKYGNKYYEDNRYFFGRHRWVVYTEEMNSKNTYWEVDGSMVPPEWSVIEVMFERYPLFGMG